MDTTLLRSWLGLPAGPWPPDDATLLGLPPGSDAALAERRALELMGRLRSHQLVHPELVTEGMNRLAQALIGLSSGVPSAPAPVQTFDLRPVESSAPRVFDAEPVVYDAEPVEPVPTKPVSAPKPVEVVWSKPAVIVPLPEVPPEPEPPIGSALSERRKAYRELAGLRALAEAWEALKATVAVPSEHLATADRVYLFLEGTIAMRVASAHPGLPAGTLDELAPILSVLVRQPLPLAILRDLRKSQRQHLARDWAVGLAKLHARQTAIRKALDRTARQRRSGALRKTVRRVLIKTPEIVLIAATVILLSIAGARVLLKP